MMARRFTIVCSRRGLKVNTDKSKVRVLAGEKGLECEVIVYGTGLEHEYEFKSSGLRRHVWNGE